MCLVALRCPFLLWHHLTVITGSIPKRDCGVAISSPSGPPLCFFSLCRVFPPTYLLKAVIFHDASLPLSPSLGVSLSLSLSHTHSTQKTTLLVPHIHLSILRRRKPTGQAFSTPPTPPPPPPPLLAALLHVSLQ